MEVTRREQGNVLELVVAGRLDAYWASHLEQEIAAVIREGRHDIALDLAGISYISSAGISVLLRFRKQLQSLDGAFSVVNPSDPVREVLTLMKLDALLAAPPPPRATAAPEPAEKKSVVQLADAILDVYPVQAGASLKCRTIGDPEAFQTGGFAEKDCRPLPLSADAFAVGLGALGSGFADCRARFGEFIAAGGAVAYQPSDGASVPDYLVSPGGAASGLHVLYGLVCEGGFSHVINFESKSGAPISLQSLALQCLAVTGSTCVGVVMAAEIGGLVGGAVRRSPALLEAAAKPFRHPEIRGWLRFTSEPAYARGVALVAGVVTQKDVDALRPMVRPMGHEEWPKGHFHAAAFTYRPLKKGQVELAETVRALFEGERLNAILHLLNDTRPIAGAGQSEFVRGVCWVAPILDTIAERK